MDRPPSPPLASYAAPYAGLRVLDLSQGIGPYAAMLLAAHGADVVKVEPPGGDWARRLGRRYGDQTAFCHRRQPRYAFQALSAALYARRDLPWGCHIDTRLMRSAAALQCVHVMANYLEGGTMRPGFTPSGNLATADGWMCLVIQSDAEFLTLCDVLELPDVRRDPRFATDESRYAHVAALTEKLNAGFARRGNVEWSARLREARLMHQPVQDYLEFLKHPHVEATGAVAWLQQPGVGQVPVPRAPGLAPFVDGSPRATAPSLDQHRDDILAQLATGDRTP